MEFWTMFDPIIYTLLGVGFGALIVGAMVLGKTFALIEANTND